MVAASLTALAMWSMSRGLDAGLLDYRIKHYYQSRVVRTRAPLERPARSDFMRPYEPDLMLELTENHVLEGWRGADLSVNAPLTRFEITFLLGRFIRQVNSRDGKIFERRKSLDHQAMWVPQKGWGLFEASDAMSEGVVTPLREGNWSRPNATPSPQSWWEGKMTRYQLAAEVAKILRALAPHYELITYFEIYPLEHLTDFAIVGHPNVSICRLPLIHGVMGGDDAGRFRGSDAVSSHDMVEVLDRLIRIVNGYRLKPATPLPQTLPDGSDDAFARPDPFPDALRTKYHNVHEIVDESHEDIYQRKQFEDEPRPIRDDP